MGANGAQIGKSKTVANQGDWRIDIENKMPGVEPGNVHLQLKGSDDKYYYNPTTAHFYTLDKTTKIFEPVSVTKNKKFLSMNGMGDALKKAFYYPGE